MQEVTVTIKLTPGRPSRGLKEQLLNESRKLSQRLGRLMVKRSRGAFKAQSYGGVRWPERYETKAPPGPFINIAGALADFNAGAAEPRQTRFETRPALVDRGELEKSLHYRTHGPFLVEEYSTRKDADEHMNGASVVMPVSSQARKAIGNWLDINPEYRPSLNRLRHSTQHRVKLWSRPFMGLTDELTAQMEREVAEFYGGRIKAHFNG